MKVHYFIRNHSCGFSIGKVFTPIISEVKKNHDVRIYEVPCHRADPISMFKNLVFTFRNRNINGVNHITGDIHYCMLALIGCKSVLTIHDIGVMDNPQNNLNLFSWYSRMILWVYLPLLIANRVTCVSNATKNNIAKYIPQRLLKKIEVINNPINSLYSFKPKEFYLKRPVILQIGTGAQKNLLRTISALKGLSCELLIIGSLDNKTRKQLEEFEISYKNESCISDGFSRGGIFGMLFYTSIIVIFFIIIEKIIFRIYDQHSVLSVNLNSYLYTIAIFSIYSNTLFSSVKGFIFKAALLSIISFTFYHILRKKHLGSFDNTCYNEDTFRNY